MGNKWVLGVNMVGISLALFAVSLTILLMLAKGEAIAFVGFALLPTLLSVGILARKNWARIIFLWIVWIAAISFGFMSGMGGMGAFITNTFISILIAGGVTFFLIRPKVKEQFK